MKLYMDLHIHTALSPCAEEEMTPNNIVNMALLKGLDIIAVTDHNSAGNVHSVIDCAHGKNIIVIPGMELETIEEVHLLCLFSNEEKALIMQGKVYSELPDLKNREDIFGEQLLFDSYDNIVGKCDRLLATATKISIEDAFSIVNDLGGVVIPAHVDRESYGILSNLGMIPENLGIKYLELSKLYETRIQSSTLSKYECIRSSDAHRLGDILERENFVEIDEASAECLIKKFQSQ